MRTKLLAAGVVALGASALALATAIPASADDTTVTFTLTGGGIDISAPASVSLGSSSGSAFSGQLGAITVTDGRNAADASWEASVTSTDFTTGGATTVETLGAADDVAYWSGAATSTTGNGTFVPGQDAVGDAAPIAFNVAFVHVDGTGNNSATWNPTVVVTPRGDSVAGTYSGIVTHSVL